MYTVKADAQFKGRDSGLVRRTGAVGMLAREADGRFGPGGQADRMTGQIHQRAHPFNSV